MTSPSQRILMLGAVMLIALLVGCGGGNAADRAGIGAQCTTKSDCFDTNQTCLTTFRGGYCGAANCTLDRDCPNGAACVSHSDGINYCFRVCLDKVECNANRSPENASNCVSSVVFADTGHTAGKACVPPSSGS